MRQVLKFMNYAAQLMALIDIRKTIKRWGTKNDTKKQKERPKIKTQMTSPSKKPPTTQKKETQPPDFSAIAPLVFNRPIGREIKQNLHKN